MPTQWIEMTLFLHMLCWILESIRAWCKQHPYNKLTLHVISNAAFYKFLVSECSLFSAHIPGECWKDDAARVMIRSTMQSITDQTIEKCVARCKAWVCNLDLSLIFSFLLLADTSYIFHVNCDGKSAVQIFSTYHIMPQLQLPYLTHVFLHVLSDFYCSCIVSMFFFLPLYSMQLYWANAGNMVQPSMIHIVWYDHCG